MSEKWNSIFQGFPILHQTKPNQTIPIYLSPPSHAHFNTENVDQPFFNVIHLGLLTHAILLAENMIGQNF